MAATDSSTSAGSNALAVDVPNLNFAFDPAAPPTLIDCNLQLTRGSRCLLIGANGAGKSTLLRIMAGKRLASASSIRVFGRDVFRDAPRGVTYLGTEWAMNPVVRSDIVVSHFLDSVGGYRHKERRDRLLNILDVDLDWRMHAISDGERRRVQLCMGLMEPWDLLLLDEVTVDLDVQVRADLLDFLAEETIKRQATIIYATHIFDGLQGFPTHVVHMRLGTTVNPKPLDWPPNESNAHEYPSLAQREGGLIERELSPLLTVALAWLREDRVIRTKTEKETADSAAAKGDAQALSRLRKRGARVGEETTDSEAFFSKYDYGAGR
ncbi:CCR4-NOT regulatory complex component [Tilletia horrida]|uniref:CCR4-NOT regulatory complex component n=1 Tax=Tilletia horrida TaxID=155126 RepID=A0AAN6GWL2_9BASI|nr:CCR4-NOT regulatory complex component [Tilletia horrida]KAK0569404.1 CCR4-NOT regulatory complex component [Tilletia horrida]